MTSPISFSRCFEALGFSESYEVLGSFSRALDALAEEQIKLRMERGLIFFAGKPDEKTIRKLAVDTNMNVESKGRIEVRTEEVPESLHSNLESALGDFDPNLTTRVVAILGSKETEGKTYFLYNLQIKRFFSINRIHDSVPKFIKSFDAPNSAMIEILNREFPTLSKFFSDFVIDESKPFKVMEDIGRNIDGMPRLVNFEIPVDPGKLSLKYKLLSVFF